MVEPPSSPAGGFDGFAAVAEGAGAPSEEEIWELPSEEERPVQPAEPELTPLGDFGGFDSFSTTEQVLAKEPLVRPPLKEPEPVGKRIPTAEPPLSELPVTMEQEMFDVPRPGAPTRAKAFEAPIPGSTPKQPPVPPVVGRLSQRPRRRQRLRSPLERRRTAKSKDLRNHQRLASPAPGQPPTRTSRSWTRLAEKVV
jgi:hypothetical protein